MDKEKIQQFCPKNQAAWRKWLADNHQKAAAVWLVYYKKHHPMHNLTWSEAVDEALCFGWIDSTRKTIDADRYEQFFTKRKPTSTWSKVNKLKIQALKAENKMTSEGLACISVAKENGTWTLLDEVEEGIIPPDLNAALTERAQDYFRSLSNSLQKGMLYWIVMAKRKETRKKRVTEIAESLLAATIPKRFR